MRGGNLFIYQPILIALLSYYTHAHVSPFIKTSSVSLPNVSHFLKPPYYATIIHFKVINILKM